MQTTDQKLYCRDCNQEFIFTAGEQEFYASRGLMNPPSRCPECRAARKGRMGGSRGGGYQRDSYREERPMYTTTCASCGNTARVPFEPRADRPVYCSDCFQSQRPSDRGGSRGGNRRSRW
ncbi:CxxC-x17-CxxC domain-containing protein [Thermosporothrix hazakensis]|jgi:CxxC-x17-CxxC domain-containing protein|uniref:CxxC-x17-CxxC domain-containing protein n=1 Tax=Thermosporothrix hazakensis TaxID=644383 RepID=A0A326U6U6_THEHA|nr:zinc-ribbon domain containing protein [Thermosporothrix hazakensis]PZW29252.1 CxxC-x17-CxxC domain-containing protein [Thermosporothrix hazakensis]GCE45397.1 zinc-binding protein [Thermosporothrix hazakensis]